MSALLFLLTFGVCIASIASDECDIKDFKPAKPFRFPQQIIWDNRTNSIFFADTNAANGTESLFRFDWNKQKLYSANLTNCEDSSPVSFVIPGQSSPDIVVVGQNQSVLRVQWNGVSKRAKLLNVIATRSEKDKGSIDRGATSPDGKLFMSIIPSTYCDECDEGYPKSSIVYLDSECEKPEIKSALTPGSYTNGISFDSTTNTCYIADDCKATVYATKLNHRSNTLENPRPVFKLPPQRPLTNYPSGLEIDQCSNFYVGDHNSNIVYYVNSKTGDVIEEYKVGGTHVTSLGIVGPNLDYLCVVTGTEYHDSKGGSKSVSTNEGDGVMYFIPISSKCCNNGCNGTPGVPVCGY